MRALQLMVHTYTETPDFGDARKFQQELDIVSQKVQKLEQDLIMHNRDLDLVESKMNLNMRHSLLTTPSRSLLSLNTTSSSTGSDKSYSVGCGSQGEGSDIDKESQENQFNDFKQVAEDTPGCLDDSVECLEIISDTFDNISEKESDVSCYSKEVNSETSNILSNHCNDDIQVDEDTLWCSKESVAYLDINSETFDNISVKESYVIGDCKDANSETSNRLSNDWDEEFEDELTVQKLIALYSYNGAEEGTLSMDLGDEFEALGADIDGWIRVRRAGFFEEGFIPTAFTQLV